MTDRWIVTPPAPELPAISRAWDVPPIVGQLLLNRGLAPHARADDFIAPQLKRLDPPDTLPGAVEAAKAITHAVRAGRRIVLYGDYDVDGITGVAILWHILSRAGASVSFYVPHRVEEGYGLNCDAVRRIARDGGAMIISIDCGVSALQAVTTAVEEGIDLIITDHHTLPETLPPAKVIVHPSVGGGGPNKDLCGAGVAFKLAWAITLQLSGGSRAEPAYRKLLMEMMPLAALGTIADVVPLLGENRILARHGLAEIAKTTLPGLRALMEIAGLCDRPISGYDVGFKLAPRLNAAGRMGHARLAVELLTRADADRAKEIAFYLDEHNRSRQATERKIARQAFDIIDQNKLAGDARRAIVLAGDHWHAGVIGIVAARLVERYHRPVVLIAIAGDEGQGSGRSIPHFDLSDALQTCRDHLSAYGGHKMAAGLRIARDRIEGFTEAFVNLANNRLTGDDMVKKLRLDGEVSLGELDLQTVEAIGGLGPFGIGNPRPRFATDWLQLVQEPRCVGRTGTHLQAMFRQNGASLRAIGFGLGERIEALKHHRRCRVAFEPIINEFNGRRTVEMRMVDLKFP